MITDVGGTVSSNGSCTKNCITVQKTIMAAYVEAQVMAALPWILIVLSISITFSNILILVAFWKNRQLRTAFNVYLIFLSFNDLAQAIFDLPLTVLGGFVPLWPLGRIACNFNLYGKWVFSALVRNSHALISLNRMWALLFPIHYKHHHTISVAVWLCVGLVVYVHVFLLPGLVADDLYYRLDDGSCSVNTTANRAWAFPTQILLYDCTLIVIVVTYPFIYWKIRKRQRTRPRSRSKTLTSTVRRSKPCTPLASFPENTVENDAQERKVDSTVRTAVVPLDRQISEANPESDRTEKRSESFAVLTYLVVGVVVCWSPILVYFTLEIACGYNQYLHFFVGSLLYYLNSFLDPWFFTMAIRPLRITVHDMLGVRR